MSRFAYVHSGGKTRKQSFQVGITVGTVGVPLIGATANNDGVLLGTTTTSADSVGMNLDTATYATAQNTDNSDPAGFVSVVTNHDAIWNCRMSGNATSGTALAKYWNGTVSTNGLLITQLDASGGSAVDWSAVDDTLVFGFEGANAGHYRRMEPAGATTATLIVAFPFDIAVDDTFILCPITPGAVQYATFTATLDEYDAEFDTALNTTPNWRCVEALYKDIGENGLLTSSVNLICGDHAFAGSALA